MSDCRTQLVTAAIRQYEEISKHGPGGFGTTMDLSAAEALELLRAAIYDPVEATRGVPSLWGYRDGRVYRFMCNGRVPAAWHGYPADEKPPNAVLQLWRSQRTISEADYNRLRRLPARGR
jgi:hypothetical protein